jgi:hypothetical protein
MKILINYKKVPLVEKMMLINNQLRESISTFCKEVADNGAFSLWGFWIASAIIASSAAFLCYKAGSGAQVYTQFISGNITWSATSKTQDYYVLIGLVIGFPATLLLLFLQTNVIRRRINAAAVADFHTLIIFASLPAVLGFGSLFLTKATSYFVPFLGLSALLILMVFLFSMIASRKSVAYGTTASFYDAVFSSVSILILGALSGLALSLILNRLCLDLNIEPYLNGMRITILCVVVFTSLSVLLIGLTWYRLTENSEALITRFRKLVIVMQGLAPWFFLILLPTPWISQGHRFYGYPMKPAAWIAVGVLIVIAYVDLVRHWRSRPSSDGSSIESAFSPMCLIGLLLFIKLGAVGIPIINQEDYHFGEFLLPWWSLSAYHMIPYWDFSPARGLVNYVPGFLSSALYDGSAASINATVPFAAAGYLVLCYPLVARSIGVIPAFLAFLLMPFANGISEIDMLITAALCVICEANLRLSPSRWLPVWIVVGTAAVLVAPGQGGLLVLATMPLGIIALFKALTNERARLFSSAGILIVFFAALSILTPLGTMLAGAVRYGIEQTSINSVANGIEWSRSWAVGGTIINQWLWEGARASWILVAIVACVVMLRAAIGGQHDMGKRAIVFAIPIFLLMTLYIFRAAGRIDPGSMSRLGLASIWAFSLLLPILLIAAYGKNCRVFILITCSFLASILSPYFSQLDQMSFIKKTTAVIEAPANVIQGRDIGLANLGNGIIEETQLKRLKAIKHVLNILVDSGETYLDLTNRNTYYFYLGYKPPIEVGAVYNLVSESQQYRAIRRLEKELPPVVLASADNILHDGGSAAYRSHLLYRYVVERYIPIRIDGFIYLVRPDRMARVAALADTKDAMTDEYRKSLLDIVFRMAFIEELPVSWGRSLKSLKTEMLLVKSLQPGNPTSLNSVRDDGGGNYSIEGSDPYITFDISNWKLSGNDAGILTFNFTCTGASSKPQLEIYWGSNATGPSESTVVRFVAENGPLVVPLDAAPRWLQAKEINCLQFDIADPVPCKAFTITNIQLWQRNITNKVIK